jgi:hypothetical protein
MAMNKLRTGIRAGSQRSLLDLALSLGWSVRKTGSNHLLLTAPHGEARISMSTTVDEKGREAKNNMAVIKRWLRQQGVSAK